MGHCAQRAAKLVASRTPFQCAGGCGAFQRKSPTGGAAKGMPRNARVRPSLTSLPCMLPCAVLTVSESAFAKHDSPKAVNNSAAMHRQRFPMMESPAKHHNRKGGRLLIRSINSCIFTTLFRKERGKGWGTVALFWIRTGGPGSDRLVGVFCR